MASQATVPHRIGALVNLVQLPTGKPALDRAPPYAQIQELPPRDNAVLPSRELGYRLIAVMRRPFSTYGRGNGRRVGHYPDGRRSCRADGAPEVI
jgi:hypothetical protein